MQRLRQLTADTIVYGLGGVVSKGIAFLTIPIFTRIFSPEEFGNIEMLVVIGNFVGSFMVMGMDSAQSMYFFKNKKKGTFVQAEIISSILQWRIIWGAIIVIFSTLLAPVLNLMIFSGNLYWEHLLIVFSSVLFAQLMSQSTEVMRLLFKPWQFILLTVSQSLTSLLFMLCAILVFDQGIIGYFIGNGLASLVVGFCGWTLLKQYLNFKQIHIKWWPQLLKFGAPLVPAEVAFYFMSSADRWFIEYYKGSEQVGLFAVASKFAMMLALAVNTFRLAFWPIALDAMHSHDGPATFRIIAYLYTSIGVLGIVILTVISPWLLEWFVGPQFYEAWPLVGILAWQPFFYGLFMIFSAGIWKAEKTYINFYLMALAAALALLLNFFLVPVYGSVGAALATVLTYFFWLFISAVISEYLWRVSFDWVLILFQIGISFVFVFYFTGMPTTENLFEKFTGAMFIIILQAYLIISTFFQNQHHR